MASSTEAAKNASSPLYCWRCDDLVRAVRPWPHWRKVWIAWCVMIGVLTILSPVMGADYFCMIPTMMGIIVAGGPIYRYATEKPTCSVCSAEIDPTRGHGTGVRARREAPPAELP